MRPYFSMPIPSWTSSATPAILQRRAQLNRYLREFFYQRQVLEVEVPLMAAAGVSDPHIDCLTTRFNQADYYLQSSPEYAMKRLLADASGDIYSLGKAFRNGEQGRRHNPEFTMLEWYRLGFDEQQLMAEVAELIAGLIDDLPVVYLSYGELFVQHLGINPYTAALNDLQALVHQHLDMGDYVCPDSSTALDILISQIIEPQLPRGLVFICDYPAEQAALARLAKNSGGQPVAKRFEAFLNGMEIANGYWELNDAAEQRRRFEHDLQLRQQQGLAAVPLDQHLMAALENGLPDCAGVAIGIDRLLMQLSSASSIAEVLSFDISRA